MKKTHITALLLVFVLLFATAAGVTYAKYIRSYEHTGNVTVTAKLVSVFKLFESEAVKQNNGSYLLSDEKVTSNTYTLLPGLDVPKDPQIHIAGKTNIPAYLYVEVVESTNFDKAKITYALTGDWQKLDGVAGQRGGTVYVYTEEIANGTIQILRDKVITVSDQLPRTTNVSLDFYAYMAQIGDGPDAKTVFTTNFPPLSP